TGVLAIGTPTGPQGPTPDVTGIAVDGTVLTISIRYTGGCKDHDFTLHWNGSFLESFPVQVHLTLTDGETEDFCKALISKQLKFDLTPLVQAYRDGYQGAGTVIVRLQTHSVQVEIPVAAGGDSSDGTVCETTHSKQSPVG